MVAVHLLAVFIYSSTQGGFEAGRLIPFVTPSLSFCKPAALNEAPIEQLAEQGIMWWPVACVATAGDAGQEHRQRVFLIFCLEIPSPRGFQAQEALVIS